eukprot:6717983-Pyramimonas_sp.AAC.1
MTLPATVLPALLPALLPFDAARLTLIRPTMYPDPMCWSAFFWRSGSRSTCCITSTSRICARTTCC